ncbi:MAG: putative metal-binding motif-containing protein [Patescibacteria group bacterium]|jgi:hypothetical protein
MFVMFFSCSSSTPATIRTPPTPTVQTDCAHVDPATHPECPHSGNQWNVPNPSKEALVVAVIWSLTARSRYGTSGPSEDAHSDQFTNCHDGSPDDIDDDGDGYTEEQGDCDDCEPRKYPGAVEICDMLDNDCDGHVDNDAIDANEMGYCDQ